MKTLLLLLTLIFAFTSFGQPPVYVSTIGLAGWWSFSGNANDESINGNDGTVNGAILTTDRYGNSNSAYYFNGIDNNINLGTPNSLTVFDTLTISAWVKTDADNHGEFVIGSSMQDRSYLMSVAESTDKFEFTISNNSLTSWDAYGESSTIVSDDQWHHIVGVFEPLIIKVYVDGVEESNIFGTVPAGIRTTLTDITIGGYQSNNFIDGAVDDIGVWNRVLTQQEITDLYIASDVAVNELTTTPKQLLKIVDLMGRETPYKPNIPLIYLYDDGSTERVFKIE